MTRTGKYGSDRLYGRALRQTGTNEHTFRQKRNKQSFPPFKAKQLETNRLSLSYKTSRRPQFRQFGPDVSPRTIGGTSPPEEPHHKKPKVSPAQTGPEITRNPAKIFVGTLPRLPHQLRWAKRLERPQTIAETILGKSLVLP